MIVTSALGQVIQIGFIIQFVWPFTILIPLALIRNAIK